MDYAELNLVEILGTYGEDKLVEILSRFMCSQNMDVQNFIRTKAIEFSKQKIAMTYLFFSDGEQPELVGYFTLANKFVSITGNELSKTLQKRILKFSQYDRELDRFLVSMPLIAQLGRNFNPSLSTSIPGTELLTLACRKVQEAQFIQFGQRNKDIDEIAESSILVQMLKYFRD